MEISDLSSSISPSMDLPSRIPASYVSSSPYLAPWPTPIPLSHVSSPPNSSPSPPSSDPNSDDAIIILEALLRQAARDAELAIAVSMKLLKSPATTSVMRQCLSQCQENYGSTVDDFVKAVNDLHANDFYMLNEDLSAVEHDIAACQQCFSEMVGGDSPMRNYEDSISGSARDCLAILEYTS